MSYLLSISYNSRLKCSLISREYGSEEDRAINPLLIGITGQHYNPSAGRVVAKTVFYPEEIEPICELLTYSLMESGYQVPASMLQLLENAKKKRPHRIVEK